jgi:phosphate transport system protein
MARLAVELCTRPSAPSTGSMPAASPMLRRAKSSSMHSRLRGVLRSLINYMVEDPRTISVASTCCSSPSRSRIGDHATNIFEHVIYAVHGENLRHAAPFSPQ